VGCGAREGVDTKGKGGGEFFSGGKGASKRKKEKGKHIWGKKKKKSPQ